MRERCGSAKQNEGVAAQIHFGVSGGDQVADFFFGHSFFQIFKNETVDVASGLAGKAQEFEFVGRFARAASDGDGIGGDAFEGGSGSAEMVVESEGKSLFDTDAAGAEIFISERRSDEIRGAFIFLPDANFDGIAHEFAHAAFFECGGDEQRSAGTRNDESEESFTESPTNAGEIVKRSAGTEEQGVEFRVEGGHEFLCVKETRVELVGSNGMDAIA